MQNVAQKLEIPVTICQEVRRLCPDKNLQMARIVEIIYKAKPEDDMHLDMHGIDLSHDVS